MACLIKVYSLTQHYIWFGLFNWSLFTHSTHILFAKFLKHFRNENNTLSILEAVEDAHYRTRTKQRWTCTVQCTHSATLFTLAELWGTFSAVIENKIDKKREPHQVHVQSWHVRVAQACIREYTDWLELHMLIRCFPSVVHNRLACFIKIIYSIPNKAALLTCFFSFYLPQHFHPSLADVVTLHILARFNCMRSAILGGHSENISSCPPGEVRPVRHTVARPLFSPNSVFVSQGVQYAITGCLKWLLTRTSVTWTSIARVQQCVWQILRILTHNTAKIFLFTYGEMDRQRRQHRVLPRESAPASR